MTMTRTEELKAIEDFIAEKGVVKGVTKPPKSYDTRHSDYFSLNGVHLFKELRRTIPRTEY